MIPDVVLQVTKEAADRDGWAIHDPVIQLRIVGESRRFELPTSDVAWVIGAAPDCDLKLEDPSGCISRQHARITRSAGVWTLQDLGSTNGIREDGERRLSFQLVPGVEIEIGGVTLIVESERSRALCAFLARIIGWDPVRLIDVDRALRAVRELAANRAALFVCGPGDLTATLKRIHRLAFADSFVARPSDVREVLRSSYDTVCLTTEEADRITVEDTARSTARIVVCAPTRDRATSAMAMFGRTATIEIPRIETRQHELERLIHEYAADAVAALGATGTAFREHELQWLRELQLATLEDLEDVTHRLVALRNWGVTGGAQRLGISHVALSRWARRRKLPT